MSSIISESLGNICRVINGKAYKQAELLNQGKYKVLRVGNFFSNNSWYYSNLELNDDKFCYNGDLLFAWSASFGPRIWNQNKTIYHYHIWKLVENSDIIDKKYLYYYLLNSTTNMMSSTHGSIMLHLTKDFMEKLPINFPKLLENQKKIANVLSVLDKKIELNNRINAELEAMAKTLYDYWFVQFDFPDANGKPYKSSGGKMVYNETLKREIPEGWGVTTIGDFESNIITGKTPSKKIDEYFNGNIPFITIGDIRENTFIVNTEETLTKSGAESQKNKYLPAGSICVTCIATPGLVGFVTTKSQTNQQINSIICKKSFSKYFLYFTIKQYFSHSTAKTGNTFANMNKKDFSDILLMSCPEQNLISFNNKVKFIFESIRLKSQENQTLKTLRDWLLPMLMNGQVKVK